MVIKVMSQDLVDRQPQNGLSTASFRRQSCKQAKKQQLLAAAVRK